MPILYPGIVHPFFNFCHGVHCTIFFTGAYQVRPLPLVLSSTTM